jgi:hypothetical protein
MRVTPECLNVVVLDAGALTDRLPAAIASAIEAWLSAAMHEGAPRDAITQSFDAGMVTDP